jgi:hypothetical protein
MATKTKKTETTIIDTAANKVLGLATKANDLALSTTEKVAMKSISLTEKGIGLSSKVVKKGLKASAKSQEVVFNTLETVKEKALKFLPKSK